MQPAARDRQHGNRPVPRRQAPLPTHERSSRTSRWGPSSARISTKYREDFDRVFHALPGLHERRTQKAGTLSGGEQQMCAIGRALMAHPNLLLLDEPSMGLAPILVERIFEIVVEINKEGHSVPARGAERTDGARHRPPRLCPRDRADRALRRGEVAAGQRAGSQDVPRRILNRSWPRSAVIETLAFTVS